MIISSSCKNIDLNCIKKYKFKKDIIVGDIVLVRVKKLGFYKQIELIDGSLMDIKENDKILCIQGNRYSTDEYLIKPSNKNTIIGNLGGVVGSCELKNSKIQSNTQIEILGYAFGNEEFLNLKQFSIIKKELITLNTKTIVVVGSDMDVGKTTCASFLIKDLSSKGKAVNYGKITGTSRLKDLFFARKNGAVKTFDFNDCGYVSTYKLSIRELKDIFENIYSNLQDKNTDYIVIEIADGLLQKETKKIIQNKLLNFLNPDIYFCSKDVLSIGEAIKILKENNLKINTISGLVATSPLHRKEIKDNYKLECLNTFVYDKD